MENWSYRENQHNIDERSMLNGVGLTQEFWVEEIDTEKYILNMYHSSALFDMTPHELSLGKKQSVSHLKLFGCDAFVHVPKEKRINIDKKELICIVIG